MLAIVVDDTEESMRTWMTEGGWTFPVVLGAEEATDAYGVTGIPAVVVVDSEGRIVDRKVGGVTASDLSALIDGLTR